MSQRRFVTLRHLFVILFLNDLIAVQHRLTISKITSSADPNIGNISYTLLDSKFSFYFYNKYIIENAIMSAEMNVKTTVDGMYTNLFTKRMNVCEFLANPNLDPLIYFGYKALTKDKRNKFFSKCPVKVVTTNMNPVNRFNYSNMFSFAGLLLRQRLFRWRYWRAVTGTQPEFCLSLWFDCAW